MPQPKNQFLRVFIPTLLIVLGIVFAFAVFRTSQSTPAPQPAATAPASTPAGSTGAAATPDAPTPIVRDPSSTASTPPQSSSPTPTPSAPAVPAGTAFHAERVTAAAPAPLGSLDPAGPYKLQLEFSTHGAGVTSIKLTDHAETIGGNDHVAVQTAHDAGPDAPPFAPLSAVSVVIIPSGGEQSDPVELHGPVWRPIDGRPGAFEARVLDDQDRPVLRIERVYLLPEGKNTFTVRQQVVNLAPYPLAFYFFERGTIDLPGVAAAYGGDKRRVHFGYLMDPKSDPTQTNVLSSKFLLEHPALIKAGEPVVKTIWPNEDSVGYSLSWVGNTNRYFGTAIFPVTDPNVVASRALPWVTRVDRVVVPTTTETAALELASARFALAPAGQTGDWADLSHMVYAGPLDREVLRKDPVTKTVGLPGFVVYNFGGMCASCTFEPVSNLLLWILHSLHKFVLHDWALSIIGLVLIVRTCLHPVTKWSQIRMARFGKQMSAVGPKQKALQEKYKTEPKKLQEETAKLWREEGISPAGMLGCIPMLFQTPIWIALYAVLFFSVELRHEGAFYGLFQRVQPGNWPTWQFLGDLAEPDRLIMFGRDINIPLIGGLLGPINSLNILPLLLGIVFFIQQKYLTPPTTGTLTPEQEFQQKLMKWMTVIMFPVFMYNAPSGLAVYFICNSTFAILESRYIRSHMDKYDLLNVDKMRAAREARQARGVGTSIIDRRTGAKAPPVKESFLERLQRLAIEKQKEAERLRRQPPKKK